jgi:hypothetical protein
MARLVTILLVTAGLLVAAGCGSPMPSSSPSPSSSPLVTARVTAATLYSAFVRHRTASLHLYKGKLLEVTGAILKTDTDPIFQAPEVVLGGASSTQGRGIDCIFEPRYASVVKRLQEGQTFTAVGTCEGFAVNVLLLRCQPGT